MALESFSVEIDVELQKFLTNLSEANIGLQKIATSAQDVAASVQVSLEKIDFANSIDTTDGVKSLENLGTSAEQTSNKVTPASKSITSSLINIGTAANPVAQASKEVNALGGTTSSLDSSNLTTFAIGFKNVIVNLIRFSEAVHPFILQVIDLDRKLKILSLGGIIRISPIFQTVVKVLGQVGRTVLPVINLFNDLGSVFKDFVKNGLSLSLISNVLDIFSRVITSAGAALKLFAGVILGLDTGNLGVLGSIIQSLGTSVDNLGNTLVGVGGDFDQFGQRVEAVANVKETISNIGNSILDFGKKVATVVLGGVGFKLLIKLLQDLTGATDPNEVRQISKFATALIDLGRSASRGASTFGILPKSVRAAATQFDKLFQAVGFANKGFTSLSINSKSASEGIQKFLGKVDIASTTLLNYTDKLGFAGKGIRALNNKINDIGAAADNQVGKFRDAGAVFSNLTKDITRAGTGAAGAIPGLDMLGQALGKTAKVGALASVTLGSVLPEAAAISAGVASSAIVVLLGLNAGIAVIGTGIALLGKSIIRFNTSLAESSSKLEIAQNLLDTTAHFAEQFGTSTDEAVASTDFFRNKVNELSKEFGITRGEVARIITQLLQLQETTGFTSDEIVDLTQKGIALGLKNEDLAQGVGAVTGALTGETRGIKLLAGANVQVEATQDRLNTLFAEGGPIAERLSGATKEQQLAYAKYTIIAEKLDPVQQSLVKSAGNLQLVQGRLTSEIKRAKEEFGQFTEAGPKLLIGIFTKVVSTFNDFPPVLKEITGSFLSFSSVSFIIIGTLIQMASTVGFLIGSYTGLNKVLAGTIPLLGNKVSEFLQDNIRAFTKTEVKIDSVKTLFKSLGPVAIEALGKVGEAASNAGTFLNNLPSLVANFVSSFTKEGFLAIKGQIAAVGVSVLTSIAGFTAWTSVVTALDGVLGLGAASIAIVVSQIALLIAVVVAVVKGFTRAVSSSDAINSTMATLAAAFGSTATIGEFFAFIMRKLGTAFEFVTTIMKLGFLVVIGAFQIALLTAIRIVRNLLATVDLLSGGFLDFSNGFLALDKAADLGVVALGKTEDALFGTSDELNKTGKEFLGLAVAATEAAKKIASTSDEIVKGFAGGLTEVRLSAEELETALEAVVAIAQNTADGQIAAARKLADALKRDASIRLDDAIQLTTELENIELEFIATVVSAEKKLAADLTDINTDVTNVKLAGLKKQLENEKSFANKFTLEARKILTESSKNEQKILEDLKGSLSTQLTAVRAFQQSRINAVTATRKRIKEIEEGLELDLFALSRKGLTAAEDREKVLIELARLRAQAILQIDKGQAAEAEKSIGEAKALISSLGTDPGLLAAIALATKAGSAVGREELNSFLDEARTVVGSVPGFVTEAFSKVNSAVNFDQAKEEVGNLIAELQRFGEQKGAKEQGDQLIELAGIAKNVQEQLGETLQLAADAASNRAAALEGELATIEGRLDKLVNDLPKEILLTARLDIDPESVKTEIGKLQNTVIELPARVVIVDADIKGGSIHSLTDAARVIADIITPKEGIPARLAVTGTPEAKGAIQTFAREAGEDIFGGFSRGISRVNALLVDESTFPAPIIPPIVIDQAIVDGLNAELSQVPKLITEAISPSKNNESVEAIVKIGDSIELPGVGSFSINEAPKFISEALTPEPIVTRLNLGGIEDGFTFINNKVGETSNKIVTQFSSAADKINAAFRTVRAPEPGPIGIDQANIGGLLTPINRVAETISDLIDPDDPEARLKINENVFIPGLGSVKFDGVPAAIAGTFNKAEVSVPVSIAQKVNLPGFGLVSLQQAEAELLRLVQPDAPVVIKVKVDEADLAKTKKQLQDIEKGIRQIGDSAHTGSITVSGAFQLARDVVNGLTKATELSVEQLKELRAVASNPLLGNQGSFVQALKTKIEEATAAIKRAARELVALQAQERQREREQKRAAAKENAPRRDIPVAFIDEDGNTYTAKEWADEQIRQAKRARDEISREALIPVQLKVEEIDIEGGSIHKLTEAASVIRGIITPEITTSLSLFTRTAKTTFDKFAESVDQIDTTIKPIISRSVLTGVVNQVKDAFKNNPVNVNLRSSGVDIKGGSFHTFSDIGDVVSKLIDPVNLQLKTALSSASLPVIPRAAPVGSGGIVGGGGGSSRTIRVELAVNGKAFNVDTANEESADSLVRFSKELELMKLTKGEAQSPFARGGSF